MCTGTSAADVYILSRPTSTLSRHRASRYPIILLKYGSINFGTKRFIGTNVFAYSRATSAHGAFRTSASSPRFSARSVLVQDLTRGKVASPLILCVHKYLLDHNVKMFFSSYFPYKHTISNELYFHNGTRYFSNRLLLLKPLKWASKWLPDSRYHLP